MSAVTATSRSAFPWLTALAAFLAVAAAGTLAALAGSGAAAVLRPAKPASPPDRIASVGPARLVVPADWRTVSPSSAGVAALEVERAAVFQPASRPWTRVVVAFDPAVEPSLIPDELRSAAVLAGQVPRPTRVRGWPAWIYHADPARAGGRDGSVTAFATTAGVLAVACTSVAGQQADSNCASEISSVAVPGARALVPSRSLALEVHLPAVVDRLNRSRSKHRARLNGAHTNESQALAARLLDVDHRAAARSLRSLGGPAAAPLIRDLTNVADAYGALARAADDASPGEFASAATGIRHAEALLTGGVAAVSRPQTAEVAARVTTQRQDRDGSAPSGVPTILFALFTALAMTAGVVTGNSDAMSGLWRRLLPRRGDAYAGSRPGSDHRHARGGSFGPPRRFSPGAGGTIELHDVTHADVHPPVVALVEDDLQPSLQLPLVKIGKGVHTHAWSDDHPACRRSGNYSSRETRTPSKVAHVGTGVPTCLRCRASVNAAT
jgi:hypothetical protein